MSFEPGLKIGQVLNNKEIMEVFKCGNSGGMRRAKKTNTLVLIANHTSMLYNYEWIDGVMHFPGMGNCCDQDINWGQNITLARSNINGVGLFLFEVEEPREYIYRGRVVLVDKPYTQREPDEDGFMRKVWIFPIMPVDVGEILDSDFSGGDVLDFPTGKDLKNSKRSVSNNSKGKKSNSSGGKVLDFSSNKYKRGNKHTDINIDDVTFLDNFRFDELIEDLKNIDDDFDIEEFLSSLNDEDFDKEELMDDLDDEDFDIEEFLNSLDDEELDDEELDDEEFQDFLNKMFGFDGLDDYVFEIPKNVLGRKLKHRLYGNGVVTEIKEPNIVVDFGKNGMRQLHYRTIISHNIVEFI